jgi:hypothetical protein
MNLTKTGGKQGAWRKLNVKVPRYKNMFMTYQRILTWVVQRVPQMEQEMLANDMYYC